MPTFTFEAQPFTGYSESSEALESWELNESGELQFERGGGRGITTEGRRAPFKKKLLRAGAKREFQGNLEQRGRCGHRDPWPNRRVSHMASMAHSRQDGRSHLLTRRQLPTGGWPLSAARRAANTYAGSKTLSIG